MFASFRLYWNFWSTILDTESRIAFQKSLEPALSPPSEPPQSIGISTFFIIGSNSSNKIAKKDLNEKNKKREEENKTKRNKVIENFSRTRFRNREVKRWF